MTLANAGPGEALPLVGVDLCTPMLTKSAVHEPKQVKRLPSGRPTSLVNRFPPETNSRLVIVRDEILDRHLHVRLLLHGLNDPPDPLLPAYHHAREPLVIEVVLRDRRGDRIKVAGGEDLNDGTRGFP